MARIQAKARQGDPSTLRDRLAEDLYRALQGEEIAGNPIFFEVPIEGEDRYRIYVIWPEWQGIDPRVRSDAILAAYNRFDEGREPDDAISPKIRLVFGLTAEEAVGNGLLPYGVHASVDPDAEGREDLRSLMRKYGAVSLGGRTQLRFPTAEMARNCLESLREATKGHPSGVEWVPGGTGVGSAWWIDSQAAAPSV